MLSHGAHDAAAPQQQRTLECLKQYQGRVSGSEQVNLVMAWHGNQEKRLYQSASNGVYIPKPLSEEQQKELHERRPVDYGFYGRYIAARTRRYCGLRCDAKWRCNYVLVHRRCQCDLSRPERQASNRCGAAGFTSLSTRATETTTWRQCGGFLLECRCCSAGC